MGCVGEITNPYNSYVGKSETKRRVLVRCRNRWENDINMYFKKVYCRLFLQNVYRVFPGGKVRPGCAADHSPPSSAVVMEE